MDPRKFLTLNHNFIQIIELIISATKENARLSNMAQIRVCV